MLRGVAYDSLAHTPLAGADVWVRGTKLRTITGSDGHFRFDTLTEGRYVLVLAHARVDSVGMEILAAAVTVETGRVATLMLATPSLRTIWSRRCSTAPAAAADSGVLMGLVTDAASGSRLAGVVLEVSAPTWSLRAVTDSTGWYYACGLSSDATAQVRVYGAGASAPAFHVRPGNRAVARRDFSMARAPTR